MRISKLVLLLLSATLCGNAFSQTGSEPSEGAPSPEGLEMLDYDNPKPYVINDIRIYGIQYLDTNILAGTTGLRKGETIMIPGNAISQAISRLWSQSYFSDVDIVVDMVGDGMVDLEIYLKEQPRVYNWLFEGVRKGEASTLTEDLKLRRGTELSDYVLDKNIYLIKKHYIGKGFRNVEVTPRIENDPVVQNAVNVTFVVQKNERVKIGEIVFEGNDEFKDRRLRRTMKKTHQVSMNFFNSFKLNEEEFENDKINLIDFYNSQGYRNAVIVKDSIYRINDKRIGIHLSLEEGNKYYIRNVKWTGNTKHSTEALQTLFGVKSGDLYDKKAIQKRLGTGKEENPEDPTQIKSIYQNDGYLMSVIDPAETIIGQDSIDLEIKVFEGNQFTINKVGISGNRRVNDEVIRRELYTMPGELYNRALIMQTMRQLSSMQHFDPQAIFPQIQPVSNELVDVSWPLTETASDKFEISGGWGAGMFVFSAGIQLNNLSLRKFFKKGAWRPYPEGENQQMTLRLQTNGSYYKSGMFSFTEPWLGGKKPTSLTVSVHASEETDGYQIGDIVRRATRFFRTTGVAVGIGQRLSWPDQYFTLYNEVGFTSYYLKNWYDAFLFTDGRSNIFTLRTVFSRNTVNQPIYPSSGSEFTLSLALTPPYSLFDKKDYKALSELAANTLDVDQQKAAQQSLYKWVEYHKWTAKALWYFPLSMDNKLVLMARAEMGYLGHYNKYKISPFEGFDVGGDGMTGYNVYGVDVIAMRGYGDGMLTPTYGSSVHDYAKVYNKYTVEVRYPILMQPMSQIYGLVFAEAGNAFMSWRDFDPFTLKRSLGFGVRIYLPYVGLVGVDWGYGFDRAVGADKRHGGRVHFMMGMQF